MRLMGWGDSSSAAAPGNPLIHSPAPSHRTHPAGPCRADDPPRVSRTHTAQAVGSPPPSRMPNGCVCHPRRAPPAKTARHALLPLGVRARTRGGVNAVRPGACPPCHIGISAPAPGTMMHELVSPSVVLAVRRTHGLQRMSHHRYSIAVDKTRRQCREV